jgi:hypothetical protein
MESKRLDEERRFFKQFNLNDEVKVRKIVLEGQEVYNQLCGDSEGKREGDEATKPKQEE